jgi:hypothetical protein
MAGLRVSGALGRARSRAVLVGLAGLAFLLPACSSSGSGQSSTSVQVQPRSLLIVGDSVAAQSAEALVHLAPESTKVTVAAMDGSAPCDWSYGFTDPYDQEHMSFASTLDKVKPGAVAFVFTGNPGLSGPPAGCVDANSAYSLSQLLASYESALTSMADRAVASGAQVYFEAPPPRNPAVPPGSDSPESGNRGFQGVHEITTFFEGLAAKQPGRWHYDDSAGRAVSTPSLSWRLNLPCEAWDSKRCQAGQVQVRAGGSDAVHLDEQGCGAIRFALAMVEHVFGTTQPDPEVVATTIASYGGCQ